MSRLRTRIAKLEQKQPSGGCPCGRPGCSPGVHLSDVDRDGKPRHPRPQLTPEEEGRIAAEHEAWRKWEVSPEGIAAQVEQERQTRRGWAAD